MKEIVDYLNKISERIVSGKLNHNTLMQTSIVNEVLYIKVFDDDYVLYNLFNYDTYRIIDSNFQVKVNEVNRFNSAQYNVVFECVLLPNIRLDIVRKVGLNNLIN